MHTASFALCFAKEAVRISSHLQSAKRLFFDDNCFARAATAGKQDELPENVISAVKTDCDAILTAAELTSDEVLEAYAYADEIKELIPILPKLSLIHI